MSQAVEDFLTREEGRRNKSLSKRFRLWLTSSQGESHFNRLGQTLSKAGSENKAALLLKKIEEAYKADDVYKRQDNKRKKSLKQFHEAFEKWLKSDKGAAYQAQIETASHAAYKNVEARRLTLENLNDEAEKAFARAFPHLLPEDYRDFSKTRIRPLRHARSKEIEEICFDVIEPGLNQLGLVGSTIVRNWARIVGSTLAENTRPEKLQFPVKSRTHGTLIILARQGFNTIIQHSSAEIIFRVNSHFGFAAVSDVRISKRFYEELETTGRRAAKKIISTRITPSPTLSPRVAELVHQIKDPEFKQAFEDLGKLIKARNG
jgi:hypothetical protein